jgi:hypothetical protein
MSRKALVSALLLASLSVPAQASDVLTNGGFETGALTPWTVNSGTPAVTSAEQHTGINSVAEFGGDEVKQTFSAIATSDITEVSFWALREGGPFDAYAFFYSDSTTGNFVLDATGASGWNQYNVTSNLAAGKSLIGFGIFGTSPGPTYLDDFLINTGAAVPEPSTWAMMLLGFGAIGLAMRRSRPRGALHAV